MNSFLTILALACIGGGAALAAFATAQALNLDGLVHKLRARSTPVRRAFASVLGIAGVGAASAALMGFGPSVFSGTFAGLTIWAGICASFVALSYAAIGGASAAAAIAKPQRREVKRAA